MPDRDAPDWMQPGVVRSRLLDELQRLPADEHLLALAAVERQDVEIILTDSATITVLIADRWRMSMPVRDVVVDADRSVDADGTDG